MKLPLVAALALTSSAFAATPGSIAPMTFQLTLHAQNAETSKTLKNGNEEYTAAVTKFAINNKVIFAEAQRLGLMTEGRLDGWQIVAAFNADTQFIGAYAYHKKLNQACYLPFIMVNAEQAGYTEAGKFQRSPADALLSGGLNFTNTAVFTVELDGVEITGVAAYTGTRTVKKTPFGGVQWIAGPLGNGSFNGFAEDEGLPVVGKLAIGPATAVADLETLFLD